MKIKHTKKDRLSESKFIQSEIDEENDYHQHQFDDINKDYSFLYLIK